MLIRTSPVVGLLVLVCACTLGGDQHEAADAEIVDEENIIEDVTFDEEDAVPGEEEPVDAVSPSEAKALDEAAEMLEEQRLPADAVEQDTSETEAVEGEDQQ